MVCHHLPHSKWHFGVISHFETNPYELQTYKMNWFYPSAENHLLDSRPNAFGSVHSIISHSLLQITGVPGDIPEIRGQLTLNGLRSPRTAQLDSGHVALVCQVTEQNLIWCECNENRLSRIKKRYYTPGCKAWKICNYIILYIS